MFVQVTAVSPLHNYRILLTFRSDELKLFDVKPLMDTEPFSALKDEILFKSARIGFDKVEWRNGATLSSEILYNGGVRVDRNYDDEDHT